MDGEWDFEKEKDMSDDSVLPEPARFTPMDVDDALVEAIIRSRCWDDDLERVHNRVAFSLAVEVRRLRRLLGAAAAWRVAHGDETAAVVRGLEEAFESLSDIGGATEREAVAAAVAKIGAMDAEIVTYRAANPELNAYFSFLSAWIADLEKRLAGDEAPLNPRLAEKLGLGERR